MLGPDQPVILHLLDIPPAAQSLEGVKMELIDAALPLLAGERLRSIACAAHILISQYYQTHQQTQKQERNFLSVISFQSTVSSEGAPHPLGRKVCCSLYASERQG
jgi:hypothetical protein